MRVWWHGVGAAREKTPAGQGSLRRQSAGKPAHCAPVEAHFLHAEMRIIAFITEALDVRAILEHIGEPAIPPHIAQARGPPEW
jgi:hypothetical protein